MFYAIAVAFVILLVLIRILVMLGRISNQLYKIDNWLERSYINQDQTKDSLREFRLETRHNIYDAKDILRAIKNKER